MRGLLTNQGTCSDQMSENMNGKEHKGSGLVRSNICSMSILDQDILSILSRTNLSENEKIRQYHQVLQQHLVCNNPGHQSRKKDILIC